MPDYQIMIGEEAKTISSLWPMVVMAVVALVGLVFWLYGERLARPGFALLGLVGGGLAAAATSGTLSGLAASVADVPNPGSPLLWGIIGGVLGGILTLVLYRILTALILAGLLGLLLPWGVAIWQHPETIPNLAEPVTVAGEEIYAAVSDKDGGSSKSEDGGEEQTADKGRRKRAATRRSCCRWGGWG